VPFTGKEAAGQPQGSGCPAANRPHVRNRALHDQLRAFGQGAAEHLTGCLESGAEIPFEVAETPGATSKLYRYRPLSSQFVRERFPELRAIDGFGQTVLGLARLEGSSAYLRVLGVDYVPAGERDRAEVVLREFLARLWDEATTFELDDRRFARAYAEFESVVYENTVVTTVLAPVIGVRLAAERWDLGEGIALARGDLCDAPPEAVWVGADEQAEPNTLVLLTVEATPQDPPPLTSARLGFRKLLTALRLFKPGTATLGATAWWRLDEGPWQPLALGFSGRPRTGDYWLEAGERDELVELFEVVRQRPLQGGPLPWALARFEIGCEQPLPVEGLSDHLLALRALLDGEEASPADVSSRLAALCAEAPDRPSLRATVERAFSLERHLMRGNLDPDSSGAVRSGAPDRIARALEDQLRALLRDIACGYLDPDVKGIADELLRDEAERRPAEPEPSGTVQPAPTGRRRRMKPEPVLESWEDVVPEPSSSPDAAEPPEPRFVVRRTKKKPERKRAADKQRRRASRSSRAEQETEETAAVGSLLERGGDEDTLDWGFDDDPADYSAAI
jgi:hypothetical protein